MWSLKIWPFSSRPAPASISNGDADRLRQLTQGYQPSQLDIAIGRVDGTTEEIEIELDNSILQGRCLVLNGFGLYNDLAVTITIDRIALLNQLLQHPELLEQISTVFIIQKAREKEPSDG